MASITVTYVTTMNEDGEDASVSFSKEGIEFLEDYLNAVGRAGRAIGFEMMTELEARSENHDKKYWTTF